MINQALQHCKGIGPVRYANLRSAGVQTWEDVLHNPQSIPAAFRASMIEECGRCLAALEQEDIQYFINRFAPQDKWRILANYQEGATFFDIETLGLSAADPITVIVAWHRGQFQVFVEHENLDDFLDCLDQVKLLVSFNGSTFDVPRVLDTFHIPELPCPHLDLRWTTYHRGLTGGLKEIASRLGIERPADLHDVSGEQAVLLWQAWEADQDQVAREHLIRYCAADALLVQMVAQRLVGPAENNESRLWATLPTVTGSPAVLGEFPPRPVTRLGTSNNGASNHPTSINSTPNSSLPNSGADSGGSPGTRSALSRRRLLSKRWVNRSA